MGKGLNQVNLLGNLGADPDLKITNAGMAIATFSLAIGEKVKKGDQWEDHTEWVRCVTFGRTAEVAGEYLRKGSQAHVTGKLRTRKWEDKDGVSKYTTEVIVNDLLLLGKGAAGGDPGSALAPAPASPQEDVPF